MPSKKKKIHLLTLLALASLFLTACAKPSPQSLVKKAQQSKIANFQLKIDEHYYTGNKPVRFYGQINYQRSPFVMQADLTQSGDQNVKMWVGQRYAYVKYYKDQQEAWYKAKLSQFTTISHFQQLVKDMDTLTLSQKSAKLFSVSRTKNGWRLSYTGKSQRLWQEITETNGLASLSSDSQMAKAKLQQIKMTIDFSQKKQLTGLAIYAKYKVKGQTSSTMLSMLKVNQQKKLAIPKTVSKNSVDVSRLNK
ncbi:hypothetical protein LD731_01035 [Lactobacillus delbrueckii subsp. delbrueckii]|uniref:hypothetical protein n=1 Tax=Lactobacillus delbrueckii TaxID=1584 RepID=UPI00090A50C0|nr:hypothetical protein [Lactobacillus delbrueckii]APG70811.1 hypothetical protein LD731_01035 [Lactobacillus delbrueckii subsp. delbrueckii]BBL26906.1 hypothetical protein LDE01_02030 [Lactobacillus delbrueckii subsp. delbrueckii]